VRTYSRDVEEAKLNMLKREYGESDVEESQTKRHRGTTGASSDIDITMSDPMVSGGEASEKGGTAKRDVAKEEGLRMWHTVRDVVNKEYVASCLIRLFCGFCMDHQF